MNNTAAGYFAVSKLGLRLLVMKIKRDAGNQRPQKKPGPLLQRPSVEIRLPRFLELLLIMADISPEFRVIWPL